LRFVGACASSVLYLGLLASLLCLRHVYPWRILKKKYRKQPEITLLDLSGIVVLCENFLEDLLLNISAKLLISPKTDSTHGRCRHILRGTAIGNIKISMSPCIKFQHAPPQYHASTDTTRLHANAVSPLVCLSCMRTKLVQVTLATKPFCLPYEYLWVTVIKYE
jgi:hypothetical protein